ncbi:MAG: hypothetical protein KAJ86_02660 [Alphaproteobacteria bacterium]|nr:hypothetical protein [Alphaproteobacteria bacterium]
MDKTNTDRIRLSDRILSALELALEQEDLKVAEVLTRSMEVTMTRNTGGNEFVERRDYPPQIEKAMDKLRDLRDKQNSI